MPLINDFTATTGTGPAAVVTITVPGEKPRLLDLHAIRSILSQCGSGKRTVTGGDLGCYPAHWLRTLFDGEPTVLWAESERNPLGADLTMEARLASAWGVPLSLGTSMVDGIPLESSVVIEASRGHLRVDNLVFPSRGHSIRLEVDGVPYMSTVAGDETYDHQLAAVVNAISRGIALPTEGADTLNTMKLIDAIYAAAGFHRSWL